MRNRGTNEAFCEIFINPVVLAKSPLPIVSSSNCGSIRLKKPIKVSRPEWVQVSYFNEGGNRHCEVFHRENGGLTIQHEIDHNLGILITDREVEE